MLIHRFYNTYLAHASYALVCKGQMAIIDPTRNPQQYYDFAKEHNANIIAVIETHPHADFVSGHLEIANTTGATIYTHPLVEPLYPFTAFAEGAKIQIGSCTLEAINTPGHSPDSICVAQRNSVGEVEAIFTGDTLFIGDVGRPDLRENAGAVTATRESLAKDLYASVQKLKQYPGTALVYPAHGAGSLCGKNLSSAAYSTIADEMNNNWAMQAENEADFVKELLQDQPFMPRYFGHAVNMNKNGITITFEDATSAVNFTVVEAIEPNVLIIDARAAAKFNEGHLPNSINLQMGGKFETWLGAIVDANEPFYLITATTELANAAVERIADIGYEANIKGKIVVENIEGNAVKAFDIEAFEANPEAYTILDVRNVNEVKSGKMFSNAIAIPLPELRERTSEIPADKPIVVHCAGGYRSPAGASIVKNALVNIDVYDIGEKIKEYEAVTS